MRAHAALAQRFAKPLGAAGRVAGDLALGLGFAALFVGLAAQIWVVGLRQGGDMALLWAGGLFMLGLLGTLAARPHSGGLLAHLLEFAVAAPLLAAGVWAGVLAAAASVVALGPHSNSLAGVGALAVFAFASAIAAAAFLLAPLLGRSRPQAAKLAGAVATATALCLMAYMALERAPQLSPASAPRPPAQMIKLSTGSTLAVWIAPAAERARAEPVVFLHGGPGGVTPPAQIALDAAFVNAAGFDAVFFDQAGSGASARLPASEYSLARAVADVEALRAALGAPRIVLHGESWGAALAMRYAGAHPNRVAGLILLSPGQAGPIRSAADAPAPRVQIRDGAPASPPTPNATASSVAPSPSPDAAPTPSPPEEAIPEAPIRIRLPTLRGRLWDALMGVNPALADALWPQNAMQGFSDWAYWDSLRAAGQVASLDTAPTVSGYSLAVARRLSAANRETPFDTAALAQTPIPAVIVRGERDFIPRGAALDHAARLANARFVEAPGLGHALDYCTRMITTSRFLLDLQGRPGAPTCQETSPDRWSWSLAHQH